MSDYKAKMHQIRFLWGSIPDPTGGAYSAPQTVQLYLRGPTSKGKEWEGEGKGNGREKGKGEEGKEGRGR